MKRTHAVVFLLGVAALAGLAFYGARTLLAPPPDDGEEAVDDDLAPDAPLAADEHFELVRSAERDVYETFPGRVFAEGSIEIRAMEGLRAVVVKIEKDVGDFVSKGDVLIRLNRLEVEKELEKAKAAKDDARAVLMQEFLDHCDIRSPVDGIVKELHTDIGEIPFDRQEGGGMPLMVLTTRDSYSLRVQVPQALTKTIASLGAKLTAELESSFGKVNGVVTGYEPAPEGWTMLVVGLEAKEGLEPEMVANLRVPTSKREVALVPKSAVTDRQGVKVVRVWEPEDHMVVERTLLVDGDQDRDWVVVAGVFPGDNVVVPGRGGR